MEERATSSMESSVSKHVKGNPTVKKVYCINHPDVIIKRKKLRTKDLETPCYKCIEVSVGRWQLIHAHLLSARCHIKNVLASLLYPRNPSSASKRIYMQPRKGQRCWLSLYDQKKVGSDHHLYIIFHRIIIMPSLSNRAHNYYGSKGIYDRRRAARSS